MPDNKKPGIDRLEPLNREACAALKARFHDMNDFIRDFGPISLLLSAEGLAFLREYQALACSLMPGLEEYLDKLAFADNLAWRARLTQLKADFSDLKIQD